MRQKNNWNKLKGNNVLNIANNMILKLEREDNNATGQTKKTNKEK